MSLVDKIKEKHNPCFPRYSMIAFYNPNHEQKIITKIKYKEHQKHNSEDVRRWDLPEGYIQKMKVMKQESMNHSKIFLRLHFEEKNKNR